MIEIEEIATLREKGPQFLSEQTPSWRLVKDSTSRRKRTMCRIMTFTTTMGTTTIETTLQTYQLKESSEEGLLI